MSVASSVLTVIVVLIVIAANNSNLGGVFEDFSGGDLLDGIGDLGGDGATDGTGLDLVYEHTLAGTGAASVAAADGVAVIAEVNGGMTKVDAFDAAGTSLWTNEYELEPTELHLFTVGGVLVIDAVASATDEGQNMRAAVSLDSGEFLWKRPWTDRNDVAFYGTDAIVEQRTGFDDNAVVRIDLTTGEEVWKKQGPEDLFIIDEYRIRAETVWDDGEEHPGTVPPNSYSLYDNLAATDRLVDLAPYEGTATVRSAADGGSSPAATCRWTPRCGPCSTASRSGSSPTRPRRAAPPSPGTPSTTSARRGSTTSTRATASPPSSPAASTSSAPQWRTAPPSSTRPSR
nr:hypothetical protein GCM10025732_58180 [Glycomyces mayteni]